MNTPIRNFLLAHAAHNPVSFHMPGHKGSALYKRWGYDDFLERIMDCDITEIPGADNLFQTEGIIKKVQEHYAELYGVKQSYLLINGTSGGIIAAILASVPKGKKIIMARNCHKSVFNALALGDIQPVYAYPELLEEYGISGAVSASEIEQLLKENPQVEAVILPSPNYYGICSDIAAIADVVHQYGKILIVDQAHGAHLQFFHKYGCYSLPRSAEECGADIIINSTHKTLASFTQSAVLNVNSERVSLSEMEDKLQCIESTSPSYLLMASLDINAAILAEQGEKLMHEWMENLQFFYEEAEKITGLKCFHQAAGLDFTKINFSLGDIGISGSELEKRLNDQYGIFIELYTGDFVMCMSGIGNTQSDYEKLLAALKEISSQYAGRMQGEGSNQERAKAAKSTFFVPQRSQLFALPKTKKRLPLEKAAGHICASSLIPYPPGIPLICPGEKMQADTLNYIKRQREQGEKVIGIDENGEVLVGCDEVVRNEDL